MRLLPLGQSKALNMKYPRLEYNDIVFVDLQRIASLLAHRASRIAPRASRIAHRSSRIAPRASLLVSSIQNKIYQINDLNPCVQIIVIHILLLLYAVVCHSHCSGRTQRKFAGFKHWRVHPAGTIQKMQMQIVGWVWSSRGVGVFRGRCRSVCRGALGARRRNCGTRKQIWISSTSGHHFVFWGVRAGGKRHDASSSCHSTDAWKMG